MSARQWTTVDKSTWGDGPWQSEPDKMQWTDAATGLPCLIVRGPSGALCGYVGVSTGHRAFEIDYANVELQDGVHGCLTFSAFCAETDDESRHICHVPEAGAPHRVWWLGFDCNHAWDEAPGSRAAYPDLYFDDFDRRYRDIAYVRDQITSLAAQLAARSA